MARKQVLIQLDPVLLARPDKHATEWTAGNRSRLIADALELLLARHAANGARDRQQRAEPNPWLPRAVTHTPDRVGEQAPITAGLIERLLAPAR